MTAIRIDGPSSLPIAILAWRASKLDCRARAIAEVGAFEARNRPSQLLDRVGRGETIVVTRRGRPVARLAPVDEGPDRAAARAAVARLLGSRKGVTLRDLSIRDLIDKGRP